MGHDRRREAAEELTQEIFLRAWQKAGQFVANELRHVVLSAGHALLSQLSQASAGVWVRTTGRHRTFAANRHDETDRSRRPAAGDSGEVQRALLSLKPKWRLVVILKDIEGLSYEEVAERLNCSTGTVASR